MHLAGAPGGQGQGEGILLFSAAAVSGEASEEIDRPLSRGLSSCDFCLS